MLNTSLIPLQNSEEFTIIEKADLILVSGFVWRLSQAGYVAATRGKMNIFMSRLIAGAGPEEIVDHINRNTLDNRTANLRICTKGQNSANRAADRRRLGTSSIYKGVSWSKTKNKWVAYLHHQGKTQYVGTFTNEFDAALAYNKRALDVWGEFARLNDIERKNV